LHLVDRANCGSEPGHNLRLELETQVHSLRPNMEEHVARCRDSMTLPSTYLAKLVQLSWARLPKQLVPGIGPKPYNTGESSLLFAKPYRTHESGEISAEGSDSNSMPSPRIDRYDKKDRGTGQPCGYRLWDSLWNV
jgi:hypothetical protein